jgi:hypothetical protein
LPNSLSHVYFIEKTIDHAYDRQNCVRHRKSTIVIDVNDAVRRNATRGRACEIHRRPEQVTRARRARPRPRLLIISSSKSFLLKLPLAKMFPIANDSATTVVAVVVPPSKRRSLLFTARSDVCVCVCVCVCARARFVSSMSRYCLVMSFGVVWVV